MEEKTEFCDEKGPADKIMTLMILWHKIRVRGSKKWFKKAIYGVKWTKTDGFCEQKAKNSATLCLTNNQLPGIISGRWKNQGGALCKSRRRLLWGKGVNL